MNGAADRLLKCREALQDIEELLEAYRAVHATTKRRRRLRALFVPLHSLCVNLVELMNQIQSDKAVHGRIPHDAPTTLTKLRTNFLSAVPFDRKGKLGLLRNRVSAHYEKTMSPAEMRELLKSTDSTEVGQWLHVAVSVLCDLLKLDAYMWTASGPKENTATIMCQEPLISVIRLEDRKVVGLEGFYMRKVSPRTLVFEHVRRVVDLSQQLFERKCLFRIGGFFEDKGRGWARSLDFLNLQHDGGAVPAPPTGSGGDA